MEQITLLAQVAQVGLELPLLCCGETSRHPAGMAALLPVVIAAVAAVVLLMEMAALGVKLFLLVQPVVVGGGGLEVKGIETPARTVVRVAVEFTTVAH